MAKKSDSRRARDAKAREAAGGKLPSARVQREKFTRCWYELKIIHARSQSYIAQLAERMKQYQNPTVLMKIAKNGDQARFDELNKEIQKLAGPTMVEFGQLWEMHADKKKLCLSLADFEKAMKVMDAYQAFDIDFFRNFSGIISELNEIFNKALKQLLDAQDDLAKNAVERAQERMLDPTIVSDVPFEEVKTEAAPLPESITDLVAPESAEKEIGVDPTMRAGLINISE